MLHFEKDAVGNGLHGTANAMTAQDLSHRYLWGPAVDQLLADEQLFAIQNGGSHGGHGRGSNSHDRAYDLAQPGRTVWPLADHLGTVRDLAVMPLRMLITGIEHDIGRGWQAQNLREFESLIAQLEEDNLLDAATRSEIAERLKEIEDMKMSVFGRMLEWVTMGHGSLAERKGSAIAGFTRELARRFRYKHDGAKWVRQPAQADVPTRPPGRDFNPGFHPYGFGRFP